MQRVKDVAQLVDRLPSMHKASGLIASTTTSTHTRKKKEKKMCHKPFTELEAEDKMVIRKDVCFSGCLHWWEKHVNK